MSSVKTYYQLTKPGIIYGNLMTAVAGYLLASKWHIDFIVFVAMLLGVSLVIASACVFNNYLDRNIDAKMARTKKRALVSGLVSLRSSIIYACILGLIGFLSLALYTNFLVLIIGLVAFIDYVVLYGLAKRHSVHGTLVGTIAGAAPIVAGYVAFTNKLDGGALLLFLILVAWQMAHFYAIAIYRFDDYKAAGLPVLPVKKSVYQAKIQIALYAAAFIVAVIALAVFGYAGYMYMIVMVLLGLAWLWRGIQGFRVADSKLWARKMFLFSLIVITGLSVMVAVGSLLP